MTEQYTRHPLIERAMDRRLPIEERRASYARWATEHAPHTHPGHGWHTHAGGNDRFHSHPTGGGNPR
jgi:hypothetical protein